MHHHARHCVPCWTNFSFFFFNSLAFCTCTKSDAFEMKALYMHIVHHRPKLLKTFGTISVFRGQIRKGTYVFVGFRLISRWCMPRPHVCSALRAGRCTWWRVSGPSGGTRWWAQSWSVSVGGRGVLYTVFTCFAIAGFHMTFQVEPPSWCFFTILIIIIRMMNSWNWYHDPPRQRNYNWLKVICNRRCELLAPNETGLHFVWDDSVWFRVHDV